MRKDETVARIRRLAVTTDQPVVRSSIIFGVIWFAAMLLFGRALWTSAVGGVIAGCVNAGIGLILRRVFTGRWTRGGLAGRGR